MYDLTLGKITGQYVDEREKGIEELIERTMPGKEIEFESNDKAKNRYIIKTYSDISSPEYYLLDI